MIQQEVQAEMPLIRGNRDQQALFARLEIAAEDCTESWNCAVFGEDKGMVVLLCDPTSGQEVWSETGSPDTIVHAFDIWLRGQARVLPSKDQAK